MYPAKKRATESNSTGLTAIFSYPLKGLDTEIAKMVPTKKSCAFEVSLLEQGFKDASQLNEVERENILRQWEAVTNNLKFNKVKKRHPFSRQIKR